MVRQELLDWFEAQALDCPVDLESIEAMLLTKEAEITRLKERISDYGWQSERNRDNEERLWRADNSWR